MSRPPVEILLVAGPSGAGKSTFIRCLRADVLPPEVSLLLPTGAAHWQELAGNDFLKRDVALEAAAQDAGRGRGIILHYDTLFIRRFGITDYRADPAFDLVARASTVVVVSILPPPEMLRSQLEGRLTEQRRRRGPLRHFWRWAVRTPLQAAVRRWRGRQTYDVAQAYQQPEEVDKCNRAWMLFAHSLVQDKPGSRLVCVEPQAVGGDTPTFVAVPDAMQGQLSRRSSSAGGW